MFASPLFAVSGAAPPERIGFAVADVVTGTRSTRADVVRRVCKMYELELPLKT